MASEDSGSEYRSRRRRRNDDSDPEAGRRYKGRPSHEPLGSERRDRAPDSARRRRSRSPDGMTRRERSRSQESKPRRRRRDESRDNYAERPTRRHRERRDESADRDRRRTDRRRLRDESNDGERPSHRGLDRSRDEKSDNNGDTRERKRRRSRDYDYDRNEARDRKRRRSRDGRRAGRDDDTDTRRDRPRAREEEEKPRSPVRRAGPLPSQSDSFALVETGGGEPAEKPKEKPNFGATGALAAEANTVAGKVAADGGAITLRYHEPPEARKPSSKDDWRLFVFKGADLVDAIPLGGRSCWLVGREAAVADLLAEHPSVSKQHAVLQFRHVEKRNEFGDRVGRVKPYLVDLESANGTTLNGEPVPQSRFLELRHKDLVRFGSSSREYVLMLAPA